MVTKAPDQNWQDFSQWLVDDPVSKKYRKRMAYQVLCEVLSNPRKYSGDIRGHRIETNTLQIMPGDIPSKPDVGNLALLIDSIHHPIKAQIALYRHGLDESYSLASFCKEVIDEPHDEIVYGLTPWCENKLGKISDKSRRLVASSMRRKKDLVFVTRNLVFTPHRDEITNVLGSMLMQAAHLADDLNDSPKKANVLGYKCIEDVEADFLQCGEEIIFALYDDKDFAYSVFRKYASILGNLDCWLAMDFNNQGENVEQAVQRIKYFNAELYVNICDMTAHQRIFHQLIRAENYGIGIFVNDDYNDLVEDMTTGHFSTFSSVWHDMQLTYDAYVDVVAELVSKWKRRFTSDVAEFVDTFGLHKHDKTFGIREETIKNYTTSSRRPTYSTSLTSV